MSFSSIDSSIIACSSGSSANSGISVLRISGNFELNDFNSFFSVNLNNLTPRYSVYTKIIRDEVVLDEAVVVYFPGPKSFTGENTLEISIHGNILNVERIINLFIDAKLVKHAHPGEFTKRAYINKKLTLSQVEGLDLFLNADTPFILDSGLSLMQGELFQSYLELEKSFKKLLSSVQIATDFVDDVGEEQSIKLLNTTFNDYFNKIKVLKRRTEGVSSILKPSVVISGKTNAGKSLLFNNFLSVDRSIVSNSHGTTRDYVSEHILVEGISFKLIDTAGIRDSDNEVEIEGIKRSNKLLKEAFFRVLVINPLDFFDEKCLKVGFDLIVLSHFDKKEFSRHADKYLESFRNIPVVALNLLGSGPIEPVGSFGPIGPNYISGPIEPLFAKCFDEFLDFINNLIINKYNEITDSNPIVVERHRQLIDVLFKQTLCFQDVMASNDLGIISSELSILQNSISELIGIITPDDLLASIFDNFCIGK